MIYCVLGFHQIDKFVVDLGFVHVGCDKGWNKKEGSRESLVN